MRTQNRFFILALFVLASGVPQTAFGFWPFGGGAQAPVVIAPPVPPKTALEELIEQGQQFYTSHKGTLITAGVGTVSVLALLAYLNRDRIREAFASSSEEQEASEKNEATLLKTMVKQLPQLAIIGGVGAFAYKNNLDQVLKVLVTKHPFVTGCVTGSSITAWFALMYLKNALMHNTRLIRALNKSKAEKQHLGVAATMLASGDQLQNIKQELAVIGDANILQKLASYEQEITLENNLQNIEASYAELRQAVLIKMLEV